MSSFKVPGREGHCYELPVILEVVSKVESGHCRKRLCREYGMASVTLDSWLRRYGSESYHANKKKAFTNESRRSIVRAILQGRITITEAQKQYGIKSRYTLQKWLRTFSQANEAVIASGPIEMKNKKKSTETEEIKALKKALADSQLKIAALETMMDIAERELKIEIRKKSGAKQSPK